ncbi:UNKNOWN [Stylonychia lemnae]|uniref:PHR domain-containing protein n=1 Tax=Stylonychia lemnae TaxID=5949 RepID=A0A078AZ35_STYLE|nr:UNKNOWN [Stylonychia lemnae]|eukprot:CDW87715.1 UNKNOWN [Stylonychia lemnae]
MGPNFDQSELPNTWECIVFNTTDQKIDQQLKNEEPKKVTIKANELDFQIQLDTVCIIDNQVTTQKHKVNIKDPIKSLIHPMKKLYLSKLSGFLFEKELELGNTFIQEQIYSNQKIVMHGVRTDKNLDGDLTRFFQRFETCSPEGGWEYYGVMDGIKLLCHRSLVFKGQQTSMAQTFYSDQGLDYDRIQNPDMGIFKLQNYEEDQSFSTISGGVIPGFLYQLL